MDESGRSAVTEWISRFDYPRTGWLQLIINSPEGPERAAREIAGREGSGNQEYADAVYPELKVIWEGMRARQAAPVAVYVPHIPLSARPLVPVSAYVQGQKISSEERTLAAITELVSQPQDNRLGQPDIAVVELPVGSACRLHELLLHERDDGRQFVIEHIDYYVIPPVCPEGVFKLSVTWYSPAVGPGMIETADEIAASLTVRRHERKLQQPMTNQARDDVPGSGTGIRPARPQFGDGMGGGEKR